jgi:hypothetical protein
MKIIQEFITAGVIGYKVGKDLKSRHHNRYRSPTSKLTIFKRDMQHRKKWPQLVKLYKEDKTKFNRIRRRYWKMRGWGNFK